MRLKYLAIGIMMLFCLNVFGQQVQKESAPKKDARMEIMQNIQSKIETQNEVILQLQTDNENMRSHLCDLEKEVDYYRGDVRAIASDLTGKMSQWLAVLSIIMVILGVVVPYILNSNKEKVFEKMLKDIKEQANKAEEALNATKELKTQISAVEAKVNNSIIAAEQSAKEAKVSQLFAQASAEMDKQKAIELYTEVIKLAPDVDAYNNRGALKCLISNYIGALDDFNKAIELDPNYASAYNNKAYTLMQMGELNKALDCVNDSLAIDNNNFAYWDTKGEVLMNLGMFSEAIKSYTKALSINEKFKPSYQNRAKCYRKLAETEEDSIKKSELIAKAEADEEKAKSLRDK